MAADSEGVIADAGADAAPAAPRWYQTEVGRRRLATALTVVAALGVGAIPVPAVRHRRVYGAGRRAP